MDAKQDRALDENADTRPFSSRLFRIVATAAIVGSVYLWTDSHQNWTTVAFVRPSYAVICEQLLGEIELRVETTNASVWTRSFNFYRQSIKTGDELARDRYDWQFADIGLAWDHRDPLDPRHSWYKLSLPNWLIVMSLIVICGQQVAKRWAWARKWPGKLATTC